MTAKKIQDSQSLQNDIRRIERLLKHSDFLIIAGDVDRETRCVVYRTEDENLYFLIKVALEQRLNRLKKQFAEL